MSKIVPADLFVVRPHVADLLGRKLAAEYLGGPSVRGWSKISSFMICERMYFLESIKKLRQRKNSPALDIGTLAHACLAAHFSSGGIKTWEPILAIKDEVPELAAEVTRLLNAYFAKYGEEDAKTWDIRAVEHEIVGNAGLSTNDGGPISSRIDLLIRKKAADAQPAPYGPCQDGVYIVDHKCVPGSARIRIRGGMMTAAEIFKRIKNKQTVEAESFDDAKREYVYKPIVAGYEIPAKPIVLIETISGRQFRLGLNHPIRTQRGYIPCEAVTDRDRVSIACHDSFENQHSSLEMLARARLLGAYISDGCVGTRVLMIGKHDAKHNAQIHSDIKFLGGRMSTYVRPDKFVVTSFTQKILPPTNVIGRHAKVKRIPDEYLDGPSDLVKNLIGMLWSGDGAIYSIAEKGRVKIRIAYTTTSELLALQVQHLLTRIGFVSTLQRSTVAYRGKRVPYTQIAIVGRQSKIEFLNQVIAKIIPVPRLYDAAIEALRVQTSLRTMGKQPKVVDGIYEDAVKYVMILPSETCFDFTVADTHTFIVADLITHNCLARITRDVVDGYGMDGQFLLMAWIWWQLALDRVFGPLNGFIINIITKTATPECRRLEVVISPEDVKRFAETLQPVVHRLEDKVAADSKEETRWPMNFAVCKNPRGYGVCKFHDYCSSHGTASNLYDIAPWTQPSAK